MTKGLMMAVQDGALAELPETLRAAPSGEIAAALLISALLLAIGVVGFLGVLYWLAETIVRRFA